MNSLPPAASANRCLGYAFTISVLIHLGIVAGLSMPSAMLPEQTMRQEAHLRVVIQASSIVKPMQMPAIAPLDTITAPPQSENLTAKTIIPARFIVEPDLDALRDIPVSFGGKIQLRLHVSSIGTVSAIELGEHDPVPNNLLNELKNNLAQTRLYPAEQAGNAVDSILEITVHFEPVTMGH